jgi:PPOX class probable F420-dependent enzyme
MTDSDLDRLGSAQYVLLTTFRRDGRAVPTPLWVARDGDALVVWTPAGSGKVKRLRNRADVTVAPCTFNGEPTGPSLVGTATILDPEASRAGKALIRRKYGVMGVLTMTGSRIRRGSRGTVCIRITI